MASAHLVFGTVKGGFPILQTNFTSVTLASGSTHTVTNQSFNYLVVSSETPMWIAFTTNGNNPNAGQSPRFKITENTLCPFYLQPNTKITVLDA